MGVEPRAKSPPHERNNYPGVFSFKAHVHQGLVKIILRQIGNLCLCMDNQITLKIEFCDTAGRAHA